MLRSVSLAVASETCGTGGKAGVITTFSGAGAVEEFTHPDKIVQQQIAADSRRYGDVTGCILIVRAIAA
jgi:hypothetical protein